ncbi:MAG: aryl-sulfate sulfotransferase [Bacteroidota bacterium]
MIKYIFNFCLVIFSNIGLYGQITPKEDSRLNYRLIGFSVQKENAIAKYIFEIAEGKYIQADSFEKHINKRETSQSNRIIATVQSYGKEYTWRVSYIGNDSSLIKQSSLFHFSTLYSIWVDTAIMKLKIVDTAIANKDQLFFLDYARGLYNVKGEILWFLPDIPGAIYETTRLRDLKMTSFGTITFQTDTAAFEITYDGKVLWRSVDSGNNDLGHHEFTRLENGNYMSLGYEYVKKMLPNIDDTSKYTNEDAVEKIDGRYYKNIEFGTLIEYNKNKEVVWKWRSSNYFTDKDLFTLKAYNGMFRVSTHMNAFFFDEKKHYVYVSFRNISRIIKIKYPKGKVIASYGRAYETKSKRKGDGLFYAQHACRISRDGCIYLFNNNVNDGKSETPSIVMLKELNHSRQKIKKTWEFVCDNIDTVAKGKSLSGGNVVELNDGSMIVCMGGINRIFIVNKDKKIVWDAVIERLHPLKSEFVPFPQYRVSPVTLINACEALIYCTQ